MTTRQSLDSALPATFPSDSATSANPAPPQAGQGQDEMHHDHYDQEDEDEEEEQDEEEVYESSSSPSTETDTLTWISWFCSLPGHEYFCEVAEDFIEDDFNLTGLAGLVPFYKEAMEMILDVEPEDDETHRVPDVSIVESSAELLYGLIHQRYIITRQGLQQMFAKFEQSHFGTCPRVFCQSHKLVPCGRSDLPGVDTVKLFCATCLDMYVPPSSRFQGVDGAFFGTTFPHLLSQTYPPSLSTLLPLLPAPDAPGGREQTTAQMSASKVYVPRIYGFKVSERARSGPRMMWMRMRPRTEGELEWDDSPSSSHNNNPSHPSSGPGGSGEKGDIFGDDDPKPSRGGGGGGDGEGSESEEEEEEEGAGGGGAGGAKEQDVESVARAVSETRLTSPVAAASAPPPPVLRQAKDGRAIKPLPSPRSSPTAAASTSSRIATSSTPSASASAASAALAASIQRHLAASGSGGVGVPESKKPARAKTFGAAAEGKGRVATRV